MRPIPCERVRVRVRTDISLTVCDFGSMLDDICAKIMRRTRDSTHVITRLVIFECISRVRAVLCCTHVSNACFEFGTLRVSSDEFCSSNCPYASVFASNWQCIFSKL